MIVEGKVKNAPSPLGSGPKVNFVSWQESDPPLLECAPQARGWPTLANSLPSSSTVGGWRAYGRPGMCLMTARVMKGEVPGIEGDVLLQFRRHNAAAGPFGTRELALIVEIDGAGNHASAPHRHRDLVRDAHAAIWGFVTLRFDYALVMHDWETVERAILAHVDRRRHRLP